MKAKKQILSDTLWAAGVVILVVLAAIWTVREMSEGDVRIIHVFVAAMITAIATGFGAIPFIYFKNFDKKWLGIGNSIAAGLMFGASVGLIYEGFTIQDVSQPALRVIIGAILGGILVYFSHKFLENRESDYSIGEIQGANAIKMLMIVGIMTIHSFAEGVGVGVSFGDSPSLGSFISIAIAIHNIPEGLAICLILIPRGVSVRKGALWSIFSSLPQPLMAIPAFLFVLVFRPFLPVGLGLAAGAMFWMVFNELLPEAREELNIKTIMLIASVTAILMFLFQMTFQL